MRSDRLVSEYDAFGRKKGEDPFAGLGGGTVEQPSSSPAPSPSDSLVPPPYAPQSAAPIAVPARPPRRRGNPWPAVLVAVIFVAVAGFIGLIALSMPTSGELESGPISAPAEPSQTGQTPPAAEPDDAPEARGLRRGSLIRRGELTQALKRLRAAELGGIVHLRVAPERINAQIKTRDGRLRNVTVTSDGLDKGSASGPGFGHVGTFATKEIDPAAPERLLRSAAKRLRRSTDQVDYLVVLDIGGPLWGVFFKDGAHFQGDAAGRITRRVN
jgi:hypothetical protein